MSISWNVCLCVDIVNVCICQDFFGCMSVCFSVRIRWNVCIYVWMCLCIYVFICMQVWRERERERKVLGGQFDCLEEGCYLSPRPNNFMSYKQILTFSVVKLMFLSFKNCQAKFHIGRQQQIFDVLSMFFFKQNFLRLSSYHSAIFLSKVN